MADTLTFQFTPAPKDYVRASRTVLLKSPGMRVNLVGMGLFELCLICATFNNDFVARVPFSWAFTLIIPGIILLLFVVIPFTAGQNVRKNDRLLVEVTWELSDDAVVLKNRYLETKYDWGSFISLTENKDYFFLRQTATKQFYTFIPKRAFVSSEQQSEFRELVSRHMLTHSAPAVSSPRFRNAAPLLIFIPTILLICVVAIGAMLYIWFAPSIGFPRFPPTATPTPLLAQTSSQYIDQARGQIFMKQYQQALPLLDKAIQLDPHNGDAYYLRANAYGNMAGTQHVYEVYQMEVEQARQDIDHAIEYGITDPNMPRGEPYYLRYQIYTRIPAPSDADVVAMEPVLRDNLRMAEALGTYDKYINQWIVFTYFNEHDCQGGFTELQRIRQKYGLSAPPNSSLYNIEANGYACLGQYDKALELIDKGLSIESFPERLYFRALVLYYLGRKQEALNTLDGLIAADPQFHAERYYFRALIEYDLGDLQATTSDLNMGDQYSWNHTQIAAYVRGRMAYDRGDKNEAARDFQVAYSTLGWLYQPCRSDSADKLSALDQPTVVATPNGMYNPTPMPSPPTIPTPDFPIAANGIQLPPFATPVSMDRGTGQFDVSGVNAYPVLLFQPPQPVTVQSVQSLTIHIIPNGPTTIDKFEIFIWNPTTGEWTMFKQGWHDIQVSDPAQYVASNGDVYLAVRTDSGIDIFIKQLWLTIQYTAPDGSQTTLDLSP